MKLTIGQSQQKTRDEGALNQAGQNQALERVKDTIRSGYDSRITSMEFQDDGASQLGPGALHQPNMRDGAQVPVRLLTREFNLPIARLPHPQVNSAPHTPSGPPDLAIDPNLQGPPTGVSLPVEGVSSAFVGPGNSTHQVVVTDAGQPTVSPFPASSPAFPGPDSLLGATAHYESRETQMQMPAVVDSSAIREPEASESFPDLEMMPVSTMSTSTVPEATQGPYQYPPPSYPYGPHSTPATFNPFPLHGMEVFQPNSVRDTNREQRLPPGLFGPQRSRDRGYLNNFSYPKNSNGLRDGQGHGNVYQFGPRDPFNDPIYQKQTFGQHDAQSHVNGNWNGGRRKGSADFGSRAFRGGVGRSNHQMFRDQIGLSNSLSRNRIGLGFNMMENHQAQVRGSLPYSESALPPRLNAQYPPMFEPHMQSVSHPGMIASGQFQPPTYGYGMRPQYTRAEQDWTAAQGVNTDLMTESEINSLNRQHVEPSNVQNAMPQVIATNPQPNAAIQMPPPELPKTTTKRRASVVSRKEKTKEPLQVRDVQTALDVTVTDPDLAKINKNGSKRTPVTKFPGKLTFGKAPHVMPMNIREPMDKGISTAAAKRHATRRANEAKAKVQIEQNQAAQQALRVKQNNSRAARAQRRESKIFGEGDA